MDIALPKEVISGLPAPDSQGLVRATVALRIGDGNSVELVEINDQPIPSDSESESPTSDDNNPMPQPPDVPPQSSLY